MTTTNRGARLLGNAAGARSAASAAGEAGSTTRDVVNTLHGNDYASVTTVDVTDQEAAAWTAIHRRESTVAVVDQQGRVVGLIPPPQLIEVLLTEHDEDLARLSGYHRSTSAARTASEESVRRRYWHRLPWLIVGPLGAILAAEVIGAFEDRLEATVLLAFLLPASSISPAPSVPRPRQSWCVACRSGSRSDVSSGSN